MTTTKKIRLAIADDHQIVIDGLQSLLIHHPSFEIVATSTFAEGMLEQLKNIQIDILLTDIMMLPVTGVELARKVHERYPQIKILALSMSGEIEMVNQMIEDESAQGYVLKNIGRQELVEALETIAKGGTYYSDEVLETLAKDTTRKKIVQTVHLTDREVEIIRLIEKEKNNKQIADQLCISERTVETHRKNIFRKTKTNSLIGLIKYAYEYKII